MDEKLAQSQTRAHPLAVKTPEETANNHTAKVVKRLGIASD
jgi:hypothetical protein